MISVVKLPNFVKIKHFSQTKKPQIEKNKAGLIASRLKERSGRVTQKEANLVLSFFPAARQRRKSFRKLKFIGFAVFHGKARMSSYCPLLSLPIHLASAEFMGVS